MPLVFLSPFKKTYSSSVCSLSTIIGLVLLITAILLPLFAAFSTDDFWLRLKEYTEQPLVDYYNNYMIYITKISSNNIYKTFFDSSIKTLNDKFSDICNMNIYHIIIILLQHLFKIILCIKKVRRIPKFSYLILKESLYLIIY